MIKQKLDHNMKVGLDLKYQIYSNKMGIHLKKNF